MENSPYTCPVLAIAKFSSFNNGRVEPELGGAALGVAHFPSLEKKMRWDAADAKMKDSAGFDITGNFRCFTG